MTLTDQLKTSANKMLSIYLINADTKPEITEKYLQWEKLLVTSRGVGQKQRSGSRRQKAGGRNQQHVLIKKKR